MTTVRARSELSGLHPHPLPPAAAHEVVTDVRWDDGDIYVKALARLGPPKPKAPGKPLEPPTKKQLGLFE